MNWIIALCATIVYGYGRIGHSLSGRIAQALLSDSANELVQKLIPEYHGKLELAANWGDTIKSNSSYDWAKSLHYINPVDDFPPKICSYHPDSKNDCPGNVCVVAAIHNYTNRLVHQTGIEKQEALKFLIHFIGDLHQPLHATGRGRGGTQARVKFLGRFTNLHSIWDYMMFEKRIHDDFNNGSDHYSDYLLNAINTTWRSEIQDWLTCPQKPQSVLLFQDTLLSVPTLPKPTTECENVMNGACISKHIKSLICRDPLCHDINLTGLDSLVCPEVWAKYSNLANCMNVWKGYQKKGEVGLPYYTKNILVEEKMLAQAAVRMAAIIEAITLLQ